MRRENRQQKSRKENKAISLKRCMKRESIPYTLGEAFRFRGVSHLHITDRIPSPSLTSSLFRSSSRAILLAKALSCLLDSVDRTEELKLSSSGGGVGGGLLREERKPIFYSNVSLRRPSLNYKKLSSNAMFVI